MIFVDERVGIGYILIKRKTLEGFGKWIAELNNIEDGVQFPESEKLNVKVVKTMKKIF